MTPTLQLLQKADVSNVTPSGESWLVINPPADWRAAGLLANAVLQSDDWVVCKALAECEFLAQPVAANGAAQVLLFLPKSKPRLKQLLATVAAMPSQPVLWLVGENAGGMKSANKLVALYFRQQEKIASAKRCALLRAAEPVVHAPPQEPTPLLSFQQWQLASAPGLFNQGEVDIASQLLIQHLPPLRGRVLDMGCGGGVLSLHARANGADSVTAVDSSAVALAACQKTIDANQVDGITPVASDVFSDVPRDIGGSFDFIISNPPFHSGQQTNYQPAQQLIEGARRYLKPAGQLWLVANRHLPYEQWLEAKFRRWDVVEQAQGFKILRAIQ